MVLKKLCKRVWGVLSILNLSSNCSICLVSLNFFFEILISPVSLIKSVPYRSNNKHLIFSWRLPLGFKDVETGFRGCIYFDTRSLFNILVPLCDLCKTPPFASRHWLEKLFLTGFRFQCSGFSSCTGCCPNPFSLCLKRFLINLRLAPGAFKTRLSGSNSWKHWSSTSPRFICKKAL